MKKLLLLTIMGLLLKTSFAQTVKHSWMVGGTALYNSKSYDKVVYENRVTAIKSRLFQINFSPDAGYFFLDRFVAGIKLLYAINKLKYLSATDFKPYKSTDYGVGPFVRYYFLPASKKSICLRKAAICM